MKGFVLTNDELAELKEAHRKAKRSNAHAAYKINAVILLGTGWKLKQVKQALLLDDETLRSYLERYREGRVKALIHTDYSGRPSGLSDPQEDQLRQELENTIHLSTLSIIDYVAKEFDKKYSQSGMRDEWHLIKL